MVGIHTEQMMHPNAHHRIYKTIYPCWYSYTSKKYFGIYVYTQNIEIYI